MQIELPQQLGLDGDFGIAGTKQKSVGQNDGGAAVLPQPVHYQHHKQLGRLAGTEVERKLPITLASVLPP